MTPSAEVKPGPHWWKASALTTGPSLSLGITDIADDNTALLVIEKARLADVGVELNDISISHRLPARNGQSKIICKFTRRATRDEVYNKCKKLKSKRSKDLPSVPASSTGDIVCWPQY